MDSTSSTVPVVIAGAGIGGLVLSLVLAEQGVDSLVVDSSGSASRSTGDVGVRPVAAHTRSIVARLCGPATDPSGDRLTHGQRAGRTYLGGRPIGTAPGASAPRADEPADVPADVLADQSAAAAMVSEAGWCELLRTAVAANPRCRPLGGHVVRAADTDRDGAGLVVEIEDPHGVARRWRASYLVLDDVEGAPSDLVRAAVTGLAAVPTGGPVAAPDASSAMGTAAPGEADVELRQRLVVELEATPTLPVEPGLHVDPPWSRGDRVLVRPLTDGGWRIDWEPAGHLDAAPEQAGDALLGRIVALAGTETAYGVRRVEAQTRRLRSWPTLRVGRCFVIGAPGAGTSALDVGALDLAVQAAENLGWKLASALRGDGGELLLESYDAERTPVLTAWSAADAEQSRLLVEQAALGSAAGGGGWRAPLRRGRRAPRRLRELAERAQPGEPPTYRGSPVVQPGAGALAPELPVVGTDGWRGTLTALRGGPFVVVAIGPTQQEALGLATAVATAMGSVRPGGAALPPHRFVGGAAADATTGHDAAGTALGNLLVVRPDGHVAWKVNGEDAPEDVAAAVAEALLRGVGR